jgi:hypothetical protein
MSGYPALQPAFTVRVDIDAPLAVGAQSGSALAIVVSGEYAFSLGNDLRSGASIKKMLMTAADGVWHREKRAWL